MEVMFMYINWKYFLAEAVDGMLDILHKFLFSFLAPFLCCIKGKNTYKAEIYMMMRQVHSM